MSFNLSKVTNIFKNIILITSMLIYFYLSLVGRNQYIFGMSYLKCILFMLLVSLFIFIYGILENREKTYKTNINTYIMLYIILLISVTFFIGRTELKFYSWWYQGQYKPFYTITSQLNYGSTLSILKNVIGNSIMLIPLSFLLMLKNDKYKNIIKQSIFILPLIIGIEVLQAYTHTGTFDIDDILLNYLGTVLFTFIITRFSMMDNIRKLFFTDFKIKDNFKNILFYAMSFVLIIYIVLLFLK